MTTRKINHRSHTIRWLEVITSGFLIVFFLFGCSFPSNQNTPNRIRINYDSDLPTRHVDIQFTLSITDDLLEEERLVIEILDEVSGLEYNKTTHELKHLQERDYGIVLSIPTGSVVKYRYAKIGDGTYIPEKDYLGLPVHYRLFYAAQAGELKDQINTWEEKPEKIKVGRLEGVILDQKTQLPIPDILVSAGGQTTFSDANGIFLIEGLVEGLHNVVFYAINGQYQTHQQGAVIAAGKITRAELNLTPAEPVTVIFNVIPPNDAAGAPIYLAGNLIQLGNTFSDLEGGMRVNPKRTVQLIPRQDGSLSIALKLFTGTDLRYKFTLGDGYWNAEQSSTGGFLTRQLIVPDEDITIDHKISTWRSEGIQPTTFDITISPGSSPQDEKFIQFNNGKWTEPIPIWPLGNGKYLYILYSPLEEDQPISYRFCRNADCEFGLSSETEEGYNKIQPSDKAQTIPVNITQWDNWQVNPQNTAFTPPSTPSYQGNFATIIELTPDMDSYWPVFASSGLTEIEKMGANTVIFTPGWSTSPSSHTLQPKIGLTPFTEDLNALMDQAQTFELTVGLFPQIRPEKGIENFWLSTPQSDVWWDEWFISYKQFILNYAKLAEQNGAKYLLVGGKSILPTFTGGVYPDGSDSSVPEANEMYWRDLIVEIRKSFTGELFWATNVNQGLDPLPEFTATFDGVYISIDSPLSVNDQPTFDEIAYGFTTEMDQSVYEVYRSTGKPVILALAYPSVDGAAQGCLLVHQQCYNDGLFLHHQTDNLPKDLDEQLLIYEAVLPIIASRDWVTGASIRGYEPTVIIQDNTSSITGKPALMVIGQWFLDILVK